MDYVEPILIYGAGILTGVILKKYIFTVQEGSAPISRLARLAAIRAKNLGRNHKMVFVVRSDLAMGKGKVAAQCAHASILCYQSAQISDLVNLDIWEATGQTKICLKCDGGEDELRSLQRKAKAMGVMNAVVRDAGYTQVEAGTTTVLGLGPAPVSAIDEITSHLKLLKIRYLLLLNQQNIMLNLDATYRMKIQFSTYLAFISQE